MQFELGEFCVWGPAVGENLPQFGPSLAEAAQGSGLCVEQNRGSFVPYSTVYSVLYPDVFLIF